MPNWKLDHVAKSEYWGTLDQPLKSRSQDLPCGFLKFSASSVVQKCHIIGHYGSHIFILSALCKSGFQFPYPHFPNTYPGYSFQLWPHQDLTAEFTDKTLFPCCIMPPFPTHSQLIQGINKPNILICEELRNEPILCANSLVTGLLENWVQISLLANQIQIFVFPPPT